MELRFPYGFALQQVIDTYGYPSHVSVSVVTATAGLGVDPATLPDRYRQLDFVYLVNGFAISVPIAPEDKSRDITPELVLTHVQTFWPPDQVGYKDSGSDPSLLALWSGFKSFEYYCSNIGIPQSMC
jgi:hypothetical protein